MVVVVVVGEKGRGKGCGYVYGPLIHLASNDKSTFKYAPFQLQVMLFVSVFLFFYIFFLVWFGLVWFGLE